MNIFACTKLGINYPEFISINEENGIVEIIVRSPANKDGSCGTTASIKLSRVEFAELKKAILEFNDIR